MPRIGPFFYIRGELIYHACSLSEGREQAGKLDNSYGHDRLYDAHFRAGEYIDYPRGRVVWDTAEERAIVYIDPCIRREPVLSKIVAAFELDAYVVASDDHYRCKRCVGDLFA